jgi:hypothetical protein
MIGAKKRPAKGERVGFSKKAFANCVCRCEEHSQSSESCVAYDVFLANGVY